MLSLICTHPDLKEFIKVKSNLNKVTKANISVRVLDEFMKAVIEDKPWKLSFIRKETGEVIEKIVSAREIFREIAEMNWDNGEPGMLFWDRIRSWNLLSEDENFEYAGVNPCIPLGEYVLTNNGFVKIENINKEIVLQGKTYKSSDLIYTGKKMVYEVELENGIIVKMTDNHKILTENGDVELKNLKVGDKVCVDYTPIYDMTIDDMEDYEKGIVAGWFVADGSFMKKKENKYIVQFAVGVNEFDYAQTLERYIKKHLDNDFKFKLHPQKKNACLTGHIYKHDIIEKFKNDILNINSWNKYDIDFENKTKSFKIGFLRAIFTCDGSSRSSSYAMYNSINKDFLHKIQRLLMEFGIYSNLTLHNRARTYIAKDGKIRNNKNSWKLEIYDAKFVEIGYLTSYKQGKLRSKAKITPERILKKKQYMKIKSIKPIGIQDVYDINVDQVHHFNLNGVIVHNCAEEPLPPGGSCLLGSINLSEFVVKPFTNEAYFDFEEFARAVEIGVIALNEALHEGLPLHPLEEQRQSVNDWRQIGLGIFGWHDALIKLGIRYGSRESLELADKIGYCMINAAIRQSALLTDIYGTYPKYNAEAVLSSPFFIENTDAYTKELVRQKGLANSQLLTIAPTGSIATMFGVSTGIEPIYSISYTRKTESLHGKDEYYKVYTPIVKKYMELEDITREDDLPEFFNTAMTIDYKERIDMQAVWQKYIDASISSTINLPEHTTVEDVEELYIYAWGKGLKGVTIFRNGCKRTGILTTNNQNNNIKPQEEPKLEWGTTIQLSDDLIGKKRKVMTGCGSLHVLAYFDPVSGKLMEVYLSKGSTGVCHSWMTATSRQISTGLRTGVSFDMIIDQLKSVPACPSYAIRTATKKDTSPGNCCPSAVANALIDMQKEVYDELGIEEMEKKPVRKTKCKNVCPECGAELRFEGGCNSCPNCGYSRCE